MGTAEDNADTDKNVEVEMNSEVEVVEKSRAEGLQNSDEL